MVERKLKHNAFLNVLIAVILGLTAILFVFTLDTTKASAENWTNRASDTSFTSTGSGNSTSPYQISTATQFATIARQISTYKAKYFELVSDIDVSAYNWSPIGTSSNPFSGSFDGKGFMVSGIKIDKADNILYAGLFGHVSGGTLKNFKVASVSPSKIIANNPSGQSVAGALVANFLGGRIENCISDGVDVFALGSSTTYAGGLVGYIPNSTNVPVLINSYNFSNVLAFSYSAYAGGIVGYVLNSSAVITYASNHGNIKAFSNSTNGMSTAGGIAGQTNTAVTLSFNKGKIESGADTSYNITIDNVTHSVIANNESYSGGIVGRTGSVANCFNTGEIVAKAKTVSEPVTYSPAQTTVFQKLVNLSSTTEEHMALLNYDYTLTYNPGGKDPPDYSKSDKVAKVAETKIAYAGGIAGYTTGTISNVYNTGLVSGGQKNISVTNAYTFIYSDPSYTPHFLVYYVTTKYIEAVYCSAINGNRQVVLTNAYGTSSNLDWTKSLIVIPYENGLTKKTETSVATSSSDTMTNIPSYRALNYKAGFSNRDMIKNVKFDLKYNDALNAFTVSLSSEISVFTSYVSESADCMTVNISNAINYNHVLVSGITPTKLGINYWETRANTNGGLPVIKELYW